MSVYEPGFMVVLDEGRIVRAPIFKRIFVNYPFVFGEQEETGQLYLVRNLVRRK